MKKHSDSRKFTFIHRIFQKKTVISLLYASKKIFMDISCIQSEILDSDEFTYTPLLPARYQKTAFVAPSKKPLCTYFLVSAEDFPSYNDPTP